MAKRGPKTRDPASIRWSPELAYAVGLIASDGNLSSDGNHIVFVSKDRQQIDNFMRCLGLDKKRIKIGRYRSGAMPEKKYLRVQFGDVGLYRWLNQVGLYSNKSKTIGALKIPDEYFFDFLRGCFDGDGSMYAYFDPRWKTSYMFYLQFTSASPGFLLWIQATVSRLIGVDGRIGPSNRSKQLRYAKRGTRALFEAMYAQSGGLHLKRKFVKAQKIFTIDERR